MEGENRNRRPPCSGTMYRNLLLCVILLEVIIIILFLVWHPRSSNKKEADIRIVFGRNALPKECPYQVLVTNHELSQTCGGTIIHKNWVLTAAQCIHTNEKYMFIAGNVYSNFKEHPNSEEQIRNVTKIFVHENFKIPKPTDNDICLLYSEKDLKFNDFVNVAKLPNNQTELKGNAILSGWGKINFNCTDVVPNSLRTTMVLINGVVGNKWLETPEPGEGPAPTQCNGDSGGGITKRDKNGKFIVIGIVSFREGELCGDPTTPQRFTNVLYYLNWIKETMKKESRHHPTTKPTKKPPTTKPHKTTPPTTKPPTTKPPTSKPPTTKPPTTKPPTTKPPTTKPPTTKPPTTKPHTTKPSTTKSPEFP